MQMHPKYKRILLKLSGEALTGNNQNPDKQNNTCILDKNTINGMVGQIADLLNLDVKIALVVGGGNIFRGANYAQYGLKRISADYMGMLATVMNGLALKDFLMHANIPCKLYSALSIPSITESYNVDAIQRDLNDHQVLIFTAGTGTPFLTTDSCAALRAIEINADLLIKATSVDGVYDCDPKHNVQAKKYNSLTFMEAMQQNLGIMDMSAFDLCRTHNINIEVCNIFKPDCLKELVLGKSTGTLIHN